MTNIRVSTVSTIDQLVKCQHIRSVAFLSTEPYEEEFDGKDLEMVAHVLVTENDNPIACMRLRHVTSEDGGTIHWGRLAMAPTLPGKLRMVTLNLIAKYVDNYSLKKGFHRAIGEVADKRLMKFWNKRGFQLTGDNPIIYGSREFWPIEKIFGKTAKALEIKDGNVNFRTSQQLQ
ncbi:hypothetical protein [Kiloniella majae]|uniref:hypothetical protein n=1 Tax=Kiloniella majae TaxID=1938558 RepID=UPI000A2773B6|nr:hypothetical protein [Kiloniella majae]